MVHSWVAEKAQGYSGSGVQGLHSFVGVEVLVMARERCGAAAVFVETKNSPVVAAVVVTVVAVVTECVQDNFVQNGVLERVG